MNSSSRLSANEREKTNGHSLQNKTVTTINSVADVDPVKSLEILERKQVTTLKLNIIDDLEDLLPTLLNLLPNLTYLTFKDMDSSIFWTNRKFIMKVLTSAMSTPEKNKTALTLSRMSLRADNLRELKDLEKFADCSNIRIESLEFAMSANFSRKTVGARAADILNKLLHSGRRSLTKLSLENCQMYLSGLNFPVLTALTHIVLYFRPQTRDDLQLCKFPANFRFSKNMPNLQDFGINYVRVEEAPMDRNFFVSVFEMTGPAPSVRRLVYSDSFLGLTIDHLMQVFPKVEQFELWQARCSPRLLLSFWNHGQHLKILCIVIFLSRFDGNVGELDSIFTGFTPETVEMIRRSPNNPPDNLEDLRVNPSILNLRELKSLVIRFHGNGQKLMPENFLAVAGQYAFKLMSKAPEIAIFVKDSGPGLERAKTALAQVSKLPNVTVKFDGSFNYFLESNFSLNSSD